MGFAVYTNYTDKRRRMFIEARNTDCYNDKIMYTGFEAFRSVEE